MGILRAGGRRGWGRVWELYISERAEERLNNPLGEWKMADTAIGPLRIEALAEQPRVYM